MPKRKHKLYQSGEDEDIPTPVSTKRPKDANSSLILDKKKKDINRKSNGLPKSTSSSSSFVNKKENINNRLNEQKQDKNSESFLTDLAEGPGSDVISSDENQEWLSYKKEFSNTSSKKKNYDSDSDSDLKYSDLDDKRISKKKSTCLPYTRAEDRMIVEYIKKHDRIKKASSNSLWKRLENSDENYMLRTYQSLKNRFKMQIVPRLLTDFRHLLDDRAINLILVKYPKLRNSNKRREPGRNRGCDDEDGIRKVLRCKKKRTESTSSKNNTNKKDVNYKQKNNICFAEKFFNSTKKVKVETDVNENSRKNYVVDEVIVIETSDEESEIKNTLNVLAVSQSNQPQFKENCDSEQETQLQGEPLSLNEVQYLEKDSSESSIPVNVNTQPLELENKLSQSQSLLFGNLNVAVEKYVAMPKKEVEKQIEKPIYKRKKIRYKPLHLYSINERMETNQLLKALVRAKRMIKELRRELREEKEKRFVEGREEILEEENEGSEEDDNEEEEKLDEDESKSLHEEESKSLGEEELKSLDEKESQSLHGEKSKSLDEEESKSLNEEESKETLEEENTASEKEEEVEAEKEVEITGLNSSNLLDYHAKRTLEIYRKLLSDSDSDGDLPMMEDFTEKLKKYSKSLIFPKKEIISSEDEEVSDNDRAKESTSSFSSKSDKSANEKEVKSCHVQDVKINLESAVNSPKKKNTPVKKLGRGLLSNMVKMMSEKEKAKLNLSLRE